MLIRSRRPTPLLAIAGLSALLGGGFAPPSFAADDSAPAAEAAAPKTPQFLTALASSSSWDDFISSSWGKDPEPTTTKDPQIALDDLELLLAPMAKDDIKAEAKGWFALVQAKEREISVAELNVRRKNREIALLEKQKAAAAELAKASQDVKAAGESGDGSDKDKAAAAARLAEAQKALVKTVETANKETAKEDKKAEATAASMAKQADASPPPASATGGEAASASAVVKVAVAAPAASDKDVLQKAADAAAAKAQQSGDAAKGAEKVDQVVAASAKEAEASEKVKSLVESAPAAASVAVAAAGAAPGAVTEAAKDTSAKAEILAKQTQEATAAKADVKVQLVDYSTQLTSERTALVDRLKLVLDKWEAKGGDPKTYRMYIASLGGLKIDVSDQAATWARVKAWLTADEGGLRWARNFAIFVGYILGSIVVAWIVRMILRRVMSMGPAAQATSHLLRDFIVASSGRAVVLIGILLGLSALEVNLAPLLAVIGAAGFVVAFALQGTLSNFASGLLIMLFKPFDVGDEVEVGGGIKGKVTQVTIFSTYIETEDGVMKIVPNDNIWKNVIVNQTTGVTKSAPADAKPAAAEPAAG